MKSLVIGAKGRIGSALLAGLIAAGHPAIGTSQRGHPLLHYDLLAPGPLPACEVVYLCAAVRRPESSIPVENEWRINVDGQLEVAARAMANGTFVVFLSSLAVETLRDHPYMRMKAHVEAALWNTGAAIVRCGTVGSDVGSLVGVLMSVGIERRAGLTRWGGL